MERRSESEIGRARAAIGEHVLFDVRLKLPGLPGKVNESDRSSNRWQRRRCSCRLHPTVKVYAGKDIDVQGIKGQVDAYSGLNLNLQDVYRLGNASAGWSHEH